MQDSIKQQEKQYSDNASLLIHKLQNAFAQNQNQIDLMEEFLENKNFEISKLQEFLISELQAIQNSRGKSSKIEKILIGKTVPLLKEVSSHLMEVKKCIEPIITIAISFVTAIAEKAQGIIQQKNAIIARQKQDLLEVNNCLNILSKEGQKLHKQLGDIKSKQSLSTSEVSYKNLKQSIVHNPIRQQNQSKVSKNENYKRSQSKTPSKVSKYQECYQNIIENKKLTLNYRCQRPLSPHDTNTSPLVKKDRPKQQMTLGVDRKQFIKQKIQKIKVRAQFKDKKSNYHYERIQ